MNVDVLYFAWVRERIGAGSERLSLPAGVDDVAALIAHLRSKSDGHQAALARPEKIRIAVNQEFVTMEHPVRAGDEVAFFPPVTGG